MTRMINNKGLTRIAFAAAVLISLSSSAATAQSDDNYRFDVVGQTSDHSMTIQIISDATGRPVTDAQVFAIHTDYRGLKAAPPVLNQRVALNPDGHGGYVYDSQDVQGGAIIQVAARMSGHDSLFWGKVQVPW